MKPTRKRGWYATATHETFWDGEHWVPETRRSVVQADLTPPKHWWQRI